MTPVCVLGLTLANLFFGVCTVDGSGPGVVTVKVCPYSVPRTAQWQRELAAERRAAKGQPRTSEMLSEWISFRDQERKCRSQP